jgi:hypothetical protein
MKLTFTRKAAEGLAKQRETTSYGGWSQGWQTLCGALRDLCSPQLA